MSGIAGGYTIRTYVSSVRKLETGYKSAASSAKLLNPSLVRRRLKMLIDGHRSIN